MSDFHRDRVTWVAYLVLAWFAFLQASPGLVIGRLRDELDLGYTTGGLHIAAFAAGALLAGVASTALERAVGRRASLWSAVALMAVGAVGLTAGRVAVVTVGSVFVMGVGGGLVLVTVQALLADHHGERRTVALAEANVAASLAYVVLAGALAAAAALDVGWRVVLLASLVVPAVLWVVNRRLAIDGPQPLADGAVAGRLPRVFWVAAAVLFCAVAAEWCVTAWGATYVEDVVGASSQTAALLMAGFFGGVLVGRVVGSRLARRHEPARLLAVALAVTAAGFGVLWPATEHVPALAGLVVLGVGLGNLFPMGISVAVGVAPELAGLASGRAVAVTSIAVLVAPLTVGTLADATSLQAAFGAVPVLLLVAAAGLAVVARAQASHRAAGVAPASPTA